MKLVLLQFIDLISRLLLNIVTLDVVTLKLDREFAFQILLK